MEKFNEQMELAANSINVLRLELLFSDDIPRTENMDERAQMFLLIALGQMEQASCLLKLAIMEHKRE